MADLDHGFRKMLDGLRQADEGRDEVMRGLEEAWAARKDLGAQLADLRDTVRVLRGMVTEQTRTVAELRQRLDDGGR